MLRKLLSASVLAVAASSVSAAPASDDAWGQLLRSTPSTPTATTPATATTNNTFVSKPSATDPWESMNRRTFQFNKKVDRYFFKPIAQGYRTVTPQWLDDGLTHFFQNLSEPLNAINNGLQGKGKAAAGDMARFVFNTITSVGLVDVAQDMGLDRHNEDFGQTLAHWGVKSGPYVVLPFFGPATIRDASMMPLDGVVNPRSLMNSTDGQIVTYAVEKIDYRADLIPLEKVIEGDEYLFLRDIYLQRRAYLVADGQVKDEFLEDDNDEEKNP